MRAGKSFRIPHLKIFATTLALVCAFTGSAHGALISRDLVSGSNDGLLTFDSDTNLEWLDLTETVGDSYNTTLASNFVTSLGFSFATTDDVATLYTNAGIVSFGGSFSASNFAGADLILDLLGCTTVCLGNQPQQTGWADLVPFSAQDASLAFIQKNDNNPIFTGRANPAFGPAGKDIALIDTGSYLIRQATAVVAVPEPGTLALFGFGLLGLICTRRRTCAAAKNIFSD